MNGRDLIRVDETDESQRHDATLAFALPDVQKARSCGSSRQFLGAPLETEPRADLYLPLRERRVGDGPGRLAIVDVVVG